MGKLYVFMANFIISLILTTRCTKAGLQQDRFRPPRVSTGSRPFRRRAVLLQHLRPRAPNHKPPHQATVYPYRRFAFFFLAPLVAVLFPAVRAFAARVMAFPAFLTVLGSRLATSCFAFFAAALTPVSARLQACLSRHVSHLIDNRFFFGIDNVRPSHSSGVERAARRLVPAAAGCERLRMVRKL